MKRDRVIRRRIQCPIRVSIDFGLYPKLILHYFSYFIGPISIGILPMCKLRFWCLLISFHVSLMCTISREHGIGHSLLTNVLLSKIHRLIYWSLILKTKLHLPLLESRSLMIPLSHLRKDELLCPSVVHIHRRRTCRWLIVRYHH